MRFREKSISKLYAFALAAVFALTLAGCGGGGGTAEEPPPPPMPTPQEMCADAGNSWVDGVCLTPAQVKFNETLAAIMAATTAEAAQAAYDAVKGDVSASDGEKLQTAVDERVGALAMMARAEEQKMKLTAAADMIDTSDLSTQEAVDAARAAIVALRGALDEADDVSAADKDMYQMQLDDAVADVDDAQDGIDTATRRTNQMGMLTSASGTLQAALAALSGSTPTQAQLDAANNALTALNTAITGAEDLTEAEKATYVREAGNAAAPIRVAQMAFDNAEDEATMDANAAMAVTASKLYAGISAQMGASDGTTFAVNDRDAFYNTAGTAISVSIGDGGDTAHTEVTATLTEDKKTMVPAHQGWQGKRYTVEPDGEGTYEAVVYSYVGAPTEGAKFNAGPDDGGYTLNAADAANPGELPITGDVANAERIASLSFDQSAGTKEFELGANMQRVVIPGSYHGVSGTYYCTAAASSTCAVELAADGFNLGGTADDGNAFTAAGGTWTFKPTNPEARVMSTPDQNYASYGWWLHKSEDGNTFTASAFVDDRGTVDDAAGITALRGTATYMGGAAGKYALSSSTGGTNDAGHFTARAMLEADFNADMITGTIDNFMGADGQSRNWSVELKKSAIGDTGLIRQSDDDNADLAAGDPGAKTAWTIGDTAAAASGEWSGALKDNGDDGVPSVGTGTFYTTFDSDGKMVGAFGVNKQ